MPNEFHDMLLNKQMVNSEPYKDCNPSEITQVYWLYAINTSVEYPQNTERSGKWLFFCSNNVRLGEDI